MNDAWECYNYLNCSNLNIISFCCLVLSLFGVFPLFPFFMMLSRSRILQPMCSIIPQRQSKCNIIKQNFFYVDNQLVIWNIFKSRFLSSQVLEQKCKTKDIDYCSGCCCNTEQGWLEMSGGCVCVYVCECMCMCVCVCVCVSVFWPGCTCWCVGGVQ